MHTLEVCTRKAKTDKRLTTMEMCEKSTNEIAIRREFTQINYDSLGHDK